jgi:hypothetical protein
MNVTSRFLGSGLAILAAGLGLALVPLAHAAVFPRSAPLGQCKIVRGRMALYNGTLSFRIWVIGTHRMLRVVDDDGDNFNDIEKLPAPLATAMRPFKSEPAGFFGRKVFARYKVCAFTMSRPGVMQSVTVTDATDIRVVGKQP